VYLNAPTESLSSAAYWNPPLSLLVVPVLFELVDEIKIWMRQVLRKKKRALAGDEAAVTV
jgi:hypothetical protein